MANSHENGQDLSAQNPTEQTPRTYSRRELLTKVAPAVGAAPFLAACGGDEKDSGFDYRTKEEEFYSERDEFEKKLDELGIDSYIDTLPPFRQEEIDHIVPSYYELNAKDQKPEFSKFYPVFRNPDGTYMQPDGYTPIANSNGTIGHYSDELFQEILSYSTDVIDWKASVDISYDQNEEIDTVDFNFLNDSNPSVQPFPSTRFIYVFSHNPEDNRWHQMGFDAGARITDRHKEDRELDSEISLLHLETRRLYDTSTTGKVASKIHDKLAFIATDVNGIPIAKTVVEQAHHSR